MNFLCTEGILLGKHVTLGDHLEQRPLEPFLSFTELTGKGRGLWQVHRVMAQKSIQDIRMRSTSPALASWGWEARCLFFRSEIQTSSQSDASQRKFLAQM